MVFEGGTWWLVSKGEGDALQNRESGTPTEAASYPRGVVLHP